jgi:hypothetical protein
MKEYIPQGFILFFMICFHILDTPVYFTNTIFLV